MAPGLVVAQVEDVAPFLIGFGLVVVVPVIALMTAHQRRMAEILHQRNGPSGKDDEVIQRLDAMQRELSDLRQRQNEIILALEDQPRTTEVQRRIGE